MLLIMRFIGVLCLWSCHISLGVCVASSATDRVSVPSSTVAERPRIAFILLGVDKKEDLSERVLKDFPAEVALSVSPHGVALDSWIGKMRLKGHDVLLALGLEPQYYPLNNPGPGALLTQLSPEENKKRLQKVLDKASGVVGVTHDMGGEGTACRDLLLPLMQELKRRGLFIVDTVLSSQSQIGEVAREISVPCTVVDQFCSEDTQEAEKAFKALEESAFERGMAVGAAFASPAFLDSLARWIQTFGQKDITLVPLSVLVR